MHPLLKTLIGVSLLGALCGCAGTSAFSVYPQQILPLRTDLLQGKEPDLAKVLNAESRGQDKILYTMERGRTAQVLGKFAESRHEFGTAIETIRDNENKAVVSVGKIGANLAALTVNDNLLPYEGEGYERILLHHYQALNYLIGRDLEGAAVEIRWANSEQESALKRHEEEVAEARRRARRDPIGNPLESKAFLQQYAQLDEVAGAVKNSFQNAATFYLSGLTYELQGLLDDAYIDYRRALELRPDNRYLQRDVLTLARRLGRDDDLRELENRFVPIDGAGHDADDSGSLVVLYEEGFVPQRSEIKVAFATPSGVIPLALPYYREHGNAPRPLRIDLDGRIMESETLCDVRLLAIKSLRERIGSLVVRQLLRAIAKVQTQKLAREKLGPLGEFAANIYSLISENADLRSWTMLPDNMQLLRVSLPPGEHRLELAGADGASFTETVTIRRGGVTILTLNRLGGRIYRSGVVY